MRPIRRERLTRWGAAAVTALCTVAVSLGLDGAQPVQQALAGVFSLGAPAVAIGLCWPRRDLLGRVALGVAGSMAVVILVSQALLMTGTWSTQAGVIGIGVVTVLVWLVAPAGQSHQAHPAGGTGDVRPAVSQGGTR